MSTGAIIGIVIGILTLLFCAVMCTILICAVIWKGACSSSSHNNHATPTSTNASSIAESTKPCNISPVEQEQVPDQYTLRQLSDGIHANDQHGQPEDDHCAAPYTAQQTISGYPKM